jgi:cytidylate kinase
MKPNVFGFLIEKYFFNKKLKEKLIPPFFNKPREKTNLPLITISRLTGSGGRTIADLVAKKLGKPWKVWDKEILEEIAKDTKKSVEFFKEFDERTISLTEEYIDDFFGKQVPIFSRYEKELIKVLTAIGQQGYAIIVGRGANYLFPNALKVRIVAPANVRLENMVKFEKNYTREQSHRWLINTDKRRDEFIKRIFGKDPNDALYYDLVINTENIPLSTSASGISLLAKSHFKLSK